MTNRRLSTTFVIALVLAALLGTAKSAFAWECEQITGGGGGSWVCWEGNDYYFVDCRGARCVYNRF